MDIRCWIPFLLSEVVQLFGAIAAIGTAVPEHRIPQLDIKEAVLNMFGDTVPQLERLLTIFDHSEIDARHFCLPLEWYTQPHTPAEKHEMFVHYAVELADRAIRSCLESAGVSPADIDMIIFVTSTGTATPSIDAHLLQRLDFRNNIKRTPLWGLGCAGGAAGLARASEYVRAFPDQLCLVVSVELCSLTFIRGDVSKSNIVATSLFADGAACALVCGAKHRLAEARGSNPRILTAQSTTWPDSLDVMGWEITNDGLKVIFSKHIPSIVNQSMPALVDSLAAAGGVQRDDLKHFALHPGGMKVLRSYESALALNSSQLRSSASVLRKYGNMSSCTIFFVLQELLAIDQPRAGDYGAVGALGPGFSAELLLLQF